MMKNNDAARPITLFYWLLVVTILSSFTDAHLIINLDTSHVYVQQETFRPRTFKSVAYFHYHNFMEVDENDNGQLYKYRSDDNYNDDWFDDKGAPTFVLANLSTVESLYEQQQQQGNGSSSLLGCDYVILILNDDSWRSRCRFWWSHSLPSSSSLLTNAMSTEGSPRYLAVTWNVGQRISQLLESYNNIIVSIDDVSPPKGRDVVAKTIFYGGIVLLLAWWVRRNENNDNNGDATLTRQEHVAITGSQLGLGEIPQDGANHECVICLETMPPGTIVRTLPCRHVYHHDCIVLWLSNGNNHTCPLCKFDVRRHLEEQELADSSLDDEEPRHDSSSSVVSWRDRIRRWKWRRIQVNENHLLDDVEAGDLELMEESTTAAAASRIADVRAV